MNSSSKPLPTKGNEMITSNDKDGEFEGFDSPMEDIPTLSEKEEALMTKMIEAEQEYEAAADAFKTDQDIQLDNIDQLLRTCSLSSWERGFCTSIEAYLKAKIGNRLSFKQKDVLANLVEKYSI